MITEDLKKFQRPDDYRPTEVKSVFNKRRQDTLNLNGWGFTDSIFVYNKGQLTFTGERYKKNSQRKFRWKSQKLNYKIAQSC